LAFTIGALSGSLAGFANTTYGLTIGLPLLAAGEGAFFALLAIVIAPLVEEHVKLLALVVLRAEEKASYPPRRWLLLGALAGAGFGVAEAVFYWQAILGFSFELANLNLLFRILVTVPMHALTATATGFGYGLARLTGSNVPLARGLVVAILIHATYNGLQVAKSFGVFG